LKKIRKILVANRGEIAVRIIKAAHTLGLEAIAVYTPDDSGSLHVTMADYSVCLPMAPLAETFLSPETMVKIALDEGCDGLHPGYGFLSENYRFAELARGNGLVFIGPPAEAIRLMGDKILARRQAEEAGVPILKSLEGDLETLIQNSSGIPFPVLVKAVAGGGGKGLIRVDKEDDLKIKLEQAVREAQSSFGDGRVFIEPFIENARHIEVQVFGDQHGNIVHLFERDCSLQRRHQKIIEEAPASGLSQGLREKLYDAALKLAKSVGYHNAGTVEFLVDGNENFYFLEMNTRIQVEHTVTEQITSIDLVREQILEAEGQALSFIQEEVKANGFAIEARIYAEDPLNHFLPSPGKIYKCRFPEGRGIRVETHVTEGYVLPAQYDSLLAKIIVSAPTREEAQTRLLKALENTFVAGVSTNIGYLQAILQQSIGKTFDTGFLQKLQSEILSEITRKRNEALESGALVYAALHFFTEAENPKNIWEKIGSLEHFGHLNVFENEEMIGLRWQQINSGVEFYTGSSRLMVEKIKREKGFISFFVNGNPVQAAFRFGANSTGVFVSGFDFNFRSNAVLNETVIEKKTIGKVVEKVDKILSPLFGKVVKINQTAGNPVRSGETILIIESMKMENHITSPADLWIEEIGVGEGENVKENQLLVRFGLAPILSDKIKV
jgi:acetyl/propionyl-CoA carboxylase alpha subunit